MPGDLEGSPLAMKAYPLDDRRKVYREDEVHDQTAFVMEYSKSSHGQHCGMEAETEEASNPSLADSFPMPNFKIILLE